MRLLTNGERLILGSCYQEKENGSVASFYVFRQEIQELLGRGMIKTYEKIKLESPMRRYFITPLGEVYAENPNLPLT
jgi:hypothetical protein